MPDGAPGRIGKYEIQAELGRGGFGCVYRGYDPRVGRQVAIKILNAGGGRDLLTRFKNEAAAAGALQHKNIVTIYEFGEDQGLPFLAMEYLEGEDLAEVIGSRKPLTLLEKVEIMSQVAEGLECAHRHGIVHRDVKPANIRLLPDGTVKIMDFGIARLLRDSFGTRLTRQGHVIGTLLYMSPEQVLGSDVDALCDIFSFGVTYYELLTFVNPFAAEDPRTVFYKITSEDPPPIHNYLQECPEALAQAIRHALQKERDLRYHTLRDLLLDTEPVVIELRQERAASLLLEARALVDGEQLEAAQDLLNTAIDLDPSNRGARQLRDTVQVVLRRRALKPRIDALLGKAAAATESGKYSEAADHLRSALQLDPLNDDIRTRLNEVTALVERAKRAAAMLTEARVEYSRKNLAGALRKADEAIEIDQRNVEAKLLAGVIRQEIEQHEQRRRFEGKLRAAREHLLNGEFAEAAAALEALEESERSTPEASELLERIEAQRRDADRQQRLSSSIARAREHIDGGRFADAVEVLRELRAEFPQEERVAGLLTYARQELAAIEREQALAALRAEAFALADRHDFDSGLRVLDSALKRFPDESSLPALRRTLTAAKAKFERQQAIEAGLRDAEQAQRENRFEDALKALDRVIGAYPDARDVVALRQSIADEWERVKRAAIAQAALAKAETCLAQGDPAGAVAALESALSCGDDRIAQGLAAARDALETKRRAEAVSKVVRDADAAVRAWQFSRALQIVDRGLAALPDEQPLRELRERIAADKERFERQRAIEEAQQTAESLRAQLRFPDAIQALERCVARYPDAHELSAFRDTLQQEWRDHMRQEEISRAVARAQACLNRDKPVEAVDTLVQILERYPEDRTLAAALARAQEAVREQQRVEAIRSAEAAVRRCLGEGDLAGAGNALAAFRAQWPGDTALDAWAEKVRIAQAEQDKKQAVEAALRGSAEQGAAGKFSQAVELLDAALRRYPGERALTDARREIENAWEQSRRREAIARALADAARKLEEDEPREAAAILGRALRFGSDPQLDAALARAQAAISARERAETVAAALSEAEAARSQSRFDKALEALDGALRAYPDDVQLARARKGVAGEKAAGERERGVSEALRKAQAAQAAGDFTAAHAVLDEALSTHGDDERLRSLMDSVERAAREAARAAWVERARSDAAELIRRGEPGRAVERLTAALSKYPDDAELQAILADARETAAQQARQREIRDCVAEADRLTKAGTPEAAAERLRAALARYPDEPELKSRLEAASADAARLAREREIRQAVAEAERLVRTGAPERAVDLLLAAQAQHPGATAINSALKAANAALESARRDAAIRQAAETTRSHLDAGRIEEAVSSIEQAVATYPGVPLLDELRARTMRLRADAVRAQAVREAVRRCEELAAAGSLAEAVEELQKSLRAYPGERSLLAVQSRLLQEWEARQRAEDIRRALETAEQLLARRQPERAVEVLNAAAAQHPGEASVLEARSRAEAAAAEKRRTEAVDAACRETRLYLDHQDFDNALSTVQRSLQAHAGEAKLTQLQQTVLARRTEWQQRQTVHGRPQARAAGATESAVTDEIKVPAPEEVPPAVSEENRPAPLGATVLLSSIGTSRTEAPPPVLPQPPLPPEPRPEPARKNLLILIGAAAGFLVVVAAFLWFRPSGPVKDRGTSGSNALVRVTTNPPGAAVTVGGRTCTTPECSLELPAGSYMVQALLLGYEPYGQQVTVERNRPLSLDLSMRPRRAALLIASNLASGSVTLDGRNAGALRGGQLDISGVSPGRHDLGVEYPGGTTTMEFTTADARLPSIDKPPQGRDIDSLVVVAFGPDAEVVCSFCSGAATLNGRAVGRFSGNRLRLKDLPAGSHTLAVEGGREILVRTGDTPSMLLDLASASAKTGTLVVDTGEGGAEVLVNGARQSRTSATGQARLTLQPGGYTISVGKDGFDPQPARQTVQVRQGAQSIARFSFNPKPASAVLSGFPPGVRVSLDGRPAGVTGPAGTLNVPIPPGAHTFEFTREGHQPVTLERSAAPGGQLTLDGDSVRFTPLPKPEPERRAPDPAQLERQAWAAVQNAGSPAELRSFLDRYGSGPHAAEARTRLEQLEWRRVDKNDRAAILAFRNQFPDSAEARLELERLDRVAAKAAEAQQQAAQQAAREKALADERSAVRRLLKDYADAFSRRDFDRLGQLRPTWSRSEVDTLRRSLERYRSVAGRFVISGEPDIQGDTATVRAAWIFEYQDSQGRREQPLSDTVRCVKRNGAWTIDSMQ